MARNTTKKTNELKSIYPKQIQSMLKTAHAKRAKTVLAKRLNSKAVTRKINESKTAQRLGVAYTYRQIATTLGNLTRGNCHWA